MKQPDEKTESLESNDMGPSKPASEAAGGVGGTLAGAAIGTVVAGPIGTVIGGIAGAVGGWWAGHAAAVAATDRFTSTDDDYYRSHYEGAGNRPADRGYVDVRPAYQLGHVAGYNPDYRGRNFDQIESDLEKGWTSDLRAKHGEWSTARNYARAAFTRQSGRRLETPSTAPHVDHDRTSSARDALLRDETNI